MKFVLIKQHNERDRAGECKGRGRERKRMGWEREGRGRERTTQNEKE
jgi:hypothetical protein